MGGSKGVGMDEDPVLPWSGGLTRGDSGGLVEHGVRTVWNGPRRREGVWWLGRRQRC